MPVNPTRVPDRPPLHRNAWPGCGLADLAPDPWLSIQCRAASPPRTGACHRWAHRPGDHVPADRRRRPTSRDRGGKPIPTENGADCLSRIDDIVLHSCGTDELAALHTPELDRTNAGPRKPERRTRPVRPARRTRFPDPDTTIVDTIIVGMDMTMTRSSSAVRSTPTAETTPTSSAGPFDYRISSWPCARSSSTTGPRAVCAGWDGMQAVLSAIIMIGSWLNLSLDWHSTTAPRPGFRPTTDVRCHPNHS